MNGHGPFTFVALPAADVSKRLVAVEAAGLAIPGQARATR